MGKKEGIRITLGENKDGVQYYVINLYSADLQLDISTCARYNDFQAFCKSLNNVDDISIPFPRKKGPFSSGTKEPEEVEKRRRDLELWLSEVYLIYNQKEVIEFVKAKLQQYGKAISNNELINAGDDPWPLYADGFAYDPIEKNWAQFILRNCGASYHKRCFFNLSGHTLTVSYIPWGQTTHIESMDDLRIFPAIASSFPYKLAFIDNSVWVYRAGVLVAFDLLENKWEVVHNIPHNLVKTVNVEREVILTADSYMGSVGKFIHILNSSAHHFYDTESKTWAQLPKCDLDILALNGSQGGYFWIHAREFVYLFVKYSTTMFPRYNLVKKTWDACPNPSSELVVNCVWDHHNKIYLWTNTKAYVHYVDRGAWVQDESIFLPHVGVAYCTDDFNPGWMEDVELRTSVISKSMNAESWEDMHKHNRITIEERAFMEHLEALPVSEKVHFFRKNKEFCIKALKSPVIHNNTRAFHLALQLAEEDPSVGAEMNKLFKFYIVNDDGQLKYYPASVENVQKLLATGNRSHLYAHHSYRN